VLHLRLNIGRVSARMVPVNIKSRAFVGKDDLARPAIVDVSWNPLVASAQRSADFVTTARAPSSLFLTASIVQPTMAAFFSRPTSAAVKIVAPPRPDGSPAPQPSQDQNRTRWHLLSLSSSHTRILETKICGNITKFGYVCTIDSCVPGQILRGLEESANLKV
jgi:hypothetical protein